MHAERLPCAVCLPRLVLVARVVFLLQRGHTDAHDTFTDVTDHTTAGVSNDCDDDDNDDDNNGDSGI